MPASSKHKYSKILAFPDTYYELIINLLQSVELFCAYILFAENYISRELLSLLKRVNGNKFERLDNMYIEAEEYNKNVQLKIGQRIQENRE